MKTVPSWMKIGSVHLFGEVSDGFERKIIETEKKSVGTSVKSRQKKFVEQVPDVQPGDCVTSVIVTNQGFRICVHFELRQVVKPYSRWPKFENVN